MPQFGEVRKFLAMPGNGSVVEHYLSAANEFDEQITIHRKGYAVFDNVLERIMALLFARDGDLARKKRLSKLIIYYMYWNCDIASEAPDNAASD
jgi:hypothetical protein